MKEQDIARFAEILTPAKTVSVLTGAGISAESGVPTFRGKDGLWKQYRAETLATPEAFSRDPKLVWEWYNWRRGIISGVEPNDGHRVLARWQDLLPSLAIITQNIDGLHQKAGSRDVVELHGNIWKLRCTDENTIHENRLFPLQEIPPLCPECGALLRPHVVWFGESLDSQIISQAFQTSTVSEVMLVIGTSAIVHPAASLPLAAKDAGAKVIEINPDPTPLTHLADISFRGKAGDILPALDPHLRKSRGPDSSDNAEDQGS